MKGILICLPISLHSYSLRMISIFISFSSENMYILGFPTGRDSATFRDSGTAKTFLSRDKGTTGQAQNFATGRDGMGF